jgi:hypothetical protein
MELGKVSDQPAAVKTSVGEFVQVLVEALAIVLLVSFFSLGVRTGMVVALTIPLVLAMTFACHALLRHRPAQDLAGGAGTGAGPVGGRRDHRRGNDGDQNGAGLRPAQGRKFCLDQHGVPDAHRYADHSSGLFADCHGAVEHRRIHPLDFPGGDHRAAGVVGGCSGVCAVSGRAVAGSGEDSCGQTRHRGWRAGPVRHAVLPARTAVGGVVRHAAAKP